MPTKKVTATIAHIQNWVDDDALYSDNGIPLSYFLDRIDEAGDELGAGDDVHIVLEHDTDMDGDWTVSLYLWRPETEAETQEREEAERRDREERWARQAAEQADRERREYERLRAKFEGGQ